jgi:MFS family permease
MAGNSLMSKSSAPPLSQSATRALSGSQRVAQSLSALKHRNYRLYWFGQLASVLAQNMEAVAQSWLVLELTNSPLMLGLTGLTFTIPTVALTLLGGAIADRADRRRIMIWAQVGSALVFLILTVLVMLKLVALWHVMALAFLTGCVRAFDRPSRMALLPQMVPKEDIPNAVAIGGTIWQLNKLVGPAVAGMLIYLVGIGPTYFVCFLASAVAIGLWLAIHLAGKPVASNSRGLLKDMTEGLSFIRQNEIYWVFIGMTFFNSVFGMSYVIMMPVFARNVLHVGSQGFGFLQSAGGGGALAGVLLAAYLSHFPGKGLQAINGAVVFGVTLILFAMSSWFPLSLVAAFALGMAGQFYMTTIHAILQMNLPNELRGRVMGIHGLAWELMPIGGLIAGAIAEFAGAPIAVAFGGLMVGGMAFVVAVVMPTIRRLQQ